MVQLGNILLLTYVCSSTASFNGQSSAAQLRLSSKVSYMRNEAHDGRISQTEAADYLAAWRPKDDGKSAQELKGIANLALKALELPYSQQVSNSMFLRYVLPYSHFDEPIDDWRPKMQEVLLPYVKNKKSLQHAAEALMPVWGSAFGKQLQFKGNQTPQMMAPFSQTLKSGYASCTGMSIFLTNCMRAVGIPARIVGTNEWNRPEKGNHNWVEIWMGDHWNFVDAVPSSGNVTWNQTWFVDQAAKQSSTPIKYAILSPLWGPEAQTTYNLSWRTPSVFVPAIDVTADYTHSAISSSWSSWFSWPISLLIATGAVTMVGGAGYARLKASKESGHTQ